MSATKPNGTNPPGNTNGVSGAVRQSVAPLTNGTLVPRPVVGQPSAKSEGKQPATNGTSNTANGARPEVPSGALQTAWLREQLGKRVTVRLSDSKTLTGTLMGYDPYTVKLQVEPQRPAMLVYKQHIAYLRAEERA